MVKLLTQSRSLSTKYWAILQFYNSIMTTFLLVFIFLVGFILLMSLGVIFMGKNIKGSCGGLNAISNSDKCLVCNKDIDPNNPLKSKLDCKK